MGRVAERQEAFGGSGGWNGADPAREGAVSAEWLHWQVDGLLTQHIVAPAVLAVLATLVLKTNVTSALLKSSVMDERQDRNKTFLLDQY